MPRAHRRAATCRRASARLIELLRVLLKMRCEDHDVAQKLVASADDLELIAADDDAEVPALQAGGARSSAPTRWR